MYFPLFLIMKKRIIPIIAVAAIRKKMTTRECPSAIVVKIIGIIKPPKPVTAVQMLAIVPEAWGKAF